MHKLATVLLLTLATPAFAARQLTEIAPILSEPQLSFEAATGAFTAWIADGQNLPGAYRVGMARVEGMTGEEALVIAANPGAEGRGGILRNATAIEPWQGKRVRLSARLASDDVERLQMWLRVLGPDQRTQMRRYDMSERPIRGSTEWRTYEIVMDVPENATLLSYGFYLEGGRGKAFADSFALERVGPEVAPTMLAGVGPDGWQVRDYTPRAQALMAAARRREAMERLQHMVNPSATHRTFYTGRAPVRSNDGYSLYYHGEAR